jgi:hypothetical protein
MAVTENVNETWATDGSREAYEASLKTQVKELEAQLRIARAQVEGAKVIVENLSGTAECRRDGWAQKEFRELRMILNGGTAIRQTARADELVEEWLQDPHRSIFGLAADLLDVMGPAPRQ